MLAINYGMGYQLLASWARLSEIEAKYLLEQLRRVFPNFARWSSEQVDLARLRGVISSKAGWPMQMTSTTEPTSLMNFPMQSAGADMLRHACTLACEAGIWVCAPLHDQLLVECETHDVFAVTTISRECMNEASRQVLDGVEVLIEDTVIRYPDRYRDGDGGPMWDLVMEKLDAFEAAEARNPTHPKHPRNVRDPKYPRDSVYLFPPLALPSNLLYERQIQNQEELQLNDEDSCGTEELSLGGAS
jgi:hypothetical protein